MLMQFQVGLTDCEWWHKCIALVVIGSAGSP